MSKDNNNLIEKPTSAKKGGLKKFLSSRKAKSGTIATAIVVIVIAVVIVLNIVVSLLVDRFPDMVLDLTSNNSYALQNDTLDYISHLDDDVTVTVLMTKSNFKSQGKYFVQAQKLLEKMESNSNGKLKLKYIDLTSNPTFTSKYPNVDWTTSSNNYVVLVESGEQYIALSLSDCFEYSEDSYYGNTTFSGTKIEQAVVKTVLNVTTKDKVVVDIITGNQEQDYSAVKEVLENNAYSVKEVSLATKGLDDKASIAILYAPSVDLDEDAATKLSKWLDNDGKYGRTLIYIPTADMPATPNIDELLNTWGMKVNTGYVFETNTEKLVSADTPFAFITNYEDYYKDGLKNPNIPVVVSDTHDITIKDSEIAHSLLTTSDKAGIPPEDVDDNWDPNDSITGKNLTVAAEGVKTNDDETSSRVVVFGSYMMFSSSVMQLNSFNNSAYLINLANTVSEKKDDGVTIESQKIENTELGITDVATQNIMLVVFVIIIPVAILIAGFVLWLRRRNK